MDYCNDIISSIYFEKQDRLMCSVHSINNLLGGNFSTPTLFKSIANDMIQDRYYSQKKPKLSFIKGYFGLLRVVF